jgi:ABC-type multidrug transport system fused ATPase/permease subunit
MLWYKSWLETRWRFVIGLVLLMFSAGSTVFTYPEVVKLISGLPTPELGGALGRRVNETLELARDYRGYIWSQWFRQNLIQMWGVFAVLLGTGGLVTQASAGGALFTLSLPVSRNRLVGVRAATGLVELAVLAFVPPLLVPLFSIAIGQNYAVSDALVHGACMFIAGTMFFSLTFLLSTVFNDTWRPALIVFCAAVVLGVLDLMLRETPALSVVRLMSGETYFRSGSLPWPGLLASVAVSLTLLYGASRNVAKRDF